MSQGAVLVALLLALAALLTAITVQQRSSDAKACRAAGGHWRTFADTCDFAGSR
jgi:hypothetical protein